MFESETAIWKSPNVAPLSNYSFKFFLNPYRAFSSIKGSDMILIESIQKK